MLLVSDWDETARTVRQAEQEDSGLIVVVLDEAEVQNAVWEHRAKDALRSRVNDFLGKTDLYARFEPIRDPLGFYGRKTYIRAIQDLVERGSPVGLFGLWRIGKSSLLHQLRQGRVFPEYPVVYLDLRHRGLKAPANQYCRGFSMD